MKSKLTTIIAGLVAILGLSTFIAPTPVLATTTDICSIDNVPTEVKQAAGCPGSNPTDYDLTDVVQKIVNAIIVVLGTLAVVIIIIGGISYMTSNGDAGKLMKAKNTILYACVGLVICVLAFAIVNFTIGILGQGTGSGTPGGNPDDECVPYMDDDGTYHSC